jgi:hypothetical protein
VVVFTGSAAALLAAVSKGAAFRATGATNMNDASSRSHAILNIMLSKDKPENGTSMCMVDLAVRLYREERSRGFFEAQVPFVQNQIACY